MANNTLHQALDRRAFLRAAATATLAATAAGTGAALLVDRRQATPVISAPPSLPLPAPVQTAVEATQDVSQLLARLAAAQSENARLQAQLAATQRRLEASQAAAGQENAANGDLLAQLDFANGEIGLLSGQVAVLSGLVALYEQLDEIDLPAVLGGGLAALSGALSPLLDRLPQAAEGLAAGERAMTEFESQVPLLDNGRRWLARHLETIGGYYEAVESALENAVEAAGSFLQKLNDWFQELLRWLPFGVGDKAAGTMASLTDLLGATPGTISGLQAYLARPLEALFEEEEGEPRLQRRLIKPVREDVLARTSEILNLVPPVQDAFDSQLVEPAQAAAERQQAIRVLIAGYRQQHQM